MSIYLTITNTHLGEGKETTQSKDGQGLSDLYLISNLLSEDFVGVVQDLNLSSLLKIRLNPPSAILHDLALFCIFVALFSI